MSRRSLLALVLLVGCGADDGSSSTGGNGGGDGGGGGGGDGVQASPICTYVKHEIQICPGPSRRDFYDGFCADAPGSDCRAVLPADQDWTTRGDGCEILVTYVLGSRHELFRPFAGSCERWLRYYDGLIECYDDASCGANETCVDDACTCGSTEFPLDGRAAPLARCDAQKVVLDEKSCSASHVIVTEPTLVDTCDPAIGESCYQPPGESAYCNGSPPPPSP